MHSTPLILSLKKKTNKRNYQGKHSLYNGDIYLALNQTRLIKNSIVSKLHKEILMTMSATFAELKLRICLFLCLICIASADSANELRPDFYNSQCSQALQVIKKEVTAAVRKDPAIGAALIRRLFYDCFVQASFHYPKTLCFAYEKFHAICFFCMYEFQYSF